MFLRLREKIIKLNNNTSDIERVDKAKRLKKKLLLIGLPLAIIGIGGAIACFVLMTLRFANTTSLKLTPMMIVYLYIPCFIIGSIGISITKLAFKVNTSESTKPLCPHCGTTIERQETLCSNCGTRLKSKCPNCGAINSGDNIFCSNCNERLY